MEPREIWPEINGEYRHFEYYFCTHCNIVHTISGEPAFKTESKDTNADDLLKWAMGLGSDTSIGVDGK